jgi:hypothetical protein
MPSVKKNCRKSKGARKTRHVKRMRGGDGASEFGVKAFGDMGQQTTIGSSTNVIKVNTVTGGKRGGFWPFTSKKPEDATVATPSVASVEPAVDAPVVAEPVTVTSTTVAPLVDADGKTTGGGVLQEIAVPAVLLYANNMFGRRKGKSTKKSYKGRSFKSKR